MRIIIMFGSKRLKPNWGFSRKRNENKEYEKTWDMLHLFSTTKCWKLNNAPPLPPPQKKN